MSRHSAHRNSKSSWKPYGHPENCYSNAAVKLQTPHSRAVHVERSTQETSSKSVRPHDPRITRRSDVSLGTQQHTAPATRFADASVTDSGSAQQAENVLRQLPVHGSGSANSSFKETAEGEGPGDGSMTIDAILQLVKNMCAEVEDRCKQKYEAMLTAKDAEQAAKSQEWEQQRIELLANDESKQGKLEQYRKEVSQLQTRLQLSEMKYKKLTADIANAANEQCNTISTMQSHYEKTLAEYNANFIKERDRLKEQVEHMEKKRRESDEEWRNYAKMYQRTKVAFEEASKEWNIEKVALEQRIDTLRANEQLYFEANEELRKRNAKLEEANARLNVPVRERQALTDTSVDEEMRNKAVATVAVSLQTLEDTLQRMVATETTILLDS